MAAAEDEEDVRRQPCATVQHMHTQKRDRFLISWWKAESYAVLCAFNVEVQQFRVIRTLNNPIYFVIIIGLC